MQVARACDLGVNDDRLIVRTHLGGILRPGRRVMGYDLRTVNVRVLKSMDNVDWTHSTMSVSSLEGVLMCFVDQFPALPF